LIIAIVFIYTVCNGRASCRDVQSKSTLHSERGNFTNIEQNRTEYVLFV